jgi:hypothetical protein
LLQSLNSSNMKPSNELRYYSYSRG